MKRFVTATVLCALVCIMCRNIAYAESNYLYETEAKIMHDLGVFEGVNTEKFDPALTEPTNREQAMIMLAKVLKWNIDEDAMSDFTDVSSWAQPYVAKAVELGVTSGKGDGLFGAQDSLTAKEVCAWILRGMGEKDGKDVWENIENYLYSYGLPMKVDQQEPLNRNQLVYCIYYGALYPNSKTGDKNLMTIVGDNEDKLLIAKEAGLIFAEEGTVPERPIDLSTHMELFKPFIDARSYFLSKLNPLAIQPTSKYGEYDWFIHRGYEGYIYLENSFHIGFDEVDKDVFMMTINDNNWFVYKGFRIGEDVPDDYKEQAGKLEMFDSLDLEDIPGYKISISYNIENKVVEGIHIYKLMEPVEISES